MKVPSRFRAEYDKVYPVLQRLEDFVKPRAQRIAERFNGSYSGRIKEPESVLIKAEERGTIYPLKEMNDLFACTITVPTCVQIPEVRAEVEQSFQVVYVDQRDVDPEKFVYSDLHLYLNVIEEFYNRDEPYLRYVFELQVKTLLQRSWSQAAHDVIYKPKRRTWGLTRMASQLRALLEMADSVLANLESAAAALQPTVDYPKYSELNSIISMLEDTWDQPSLPLQPHRLRAARVIRDYLQLAGLTIEDLVGLLGREEYTPYVSAQSLTPTEAVFIILFLEKWGDMRGRLRARRLLVTDEMLDLCPTLQRIPNDCRMRFD